MEKDILSIYCPGCGAPAEFDIVRQVYRCSYCGTSVMLEHARQEKEQYREQVRQKIKRSTSDFPLMTSSCSGCGATLVFEENEAVAACAFCGRKLVRKKYAQAGDVPQGIIPFAVTGEEAKNRLADWCAKNRNKREAGHLLQKIDDLKGYYLPYQMFRGPVYCDVRKKKDTSVFSAGGYLHGEFVNCSKQLDNTVLDAMEPYDTAELREFDYAFVAGQRVKIPDITTEETRNRLKQEVDSNYRVFMEEIWGTKAIDMDSRVETVVDSPVLLPVYYIKDGTVSAAVNGQTGKVSVRAEKMSLYISLPWWLEALLLFLLACAAFFGISRLGSWSVEESLLVTGILAAFYLFIFCFMFEPGLDNTGSIIRYRNIFNSGDQTFRRERGKLVLRDEILKRRIAEPVFMKELDGKNTHVAYVFRSFSRIAGMIALAVVYVFFPVILALLINGFDFQKLTLGGSAAWFCISVPTAPIILIQIGLKELYSNPWIYTVSDTGEKKRLRGNGSLKAKDRLRMVFGLLLHPLVWLALAFLGVMVYLTAFGF